MRCTISSVAMFAFEPGTLGKRILWRVATRVGGGWRRGPGHWTNHLHEGDAAIEGIDLVPEIIEKAHAPFPDVPLKVEGGRLLIGFFDGSPGHRSNTLSILRTTGSLKRYRIC